MATHSYTHQDAWGNEREGYSERSQVSYAPASPANGSGGFSFVRFEEWIASLGAAGALGWAARIASASYPNLDVLWQTPGPLETLGIAVLIWLHAKWRRSVSLR